MKEALSIRNRTLAGILAGTLALSGCGGGSSSSRKTTGETMAVPRVPELQAGDNIRNTRLIKVGPTKKNETFTLHPDSPYPEDLGVVYNKGLSGSLLATMGDTDPDHAVGILLTESSGQASFSFIFFEHQSGVIAHIGQSAPLKEGPQELFGFGEGSKYYQLNVNPTPDGEVLVSCNPAKL